MIENGANWFIKLNIICTFPRKTIDLWIVYSQPQNILVPIEQFREMFFFLRENWNYMTKHGIHICDCIFCIFDKMWQFWNIFMYFELSSTHFLNPLMHCLPKSFPYILVFLLLQIENNIVFQTKNMVLYSYTWLWHHRTYTNITYYWHGQNNRKDVFNIFVRKKKNFFLLIMVERQRCVGKTFLMSETPGTPFKTRYSYTVPKTGGKCDFHRKYTVPGFSRSNTTLKNVTWKVRDFFVVVFIKKTKENEKKVKMLRGYENGHFWLRCNNFDYVRVNLQMAIS